MTNVHYQKSKIVYTSNLLRLHMQVWQLGTNEKLEWKYFCVVKVTQYEAYEKDRKLTSYCKHEIWVLKLRNPFYKRQISFLVVKTVKCKRGIKWPHKTDKGYLYSKRKSNVNFSVKAFRQTMSGLQLERALAPTLFSILFWESKRITKF